VEEEAFKLSGCQVVQCGGSDDKLRPMGITEDYSLTLLAFQDCVQWCMVGFQGVRRRRQLRVGVPTWVWL
jgi:hypothetical protein